MCFIEPKGYAGRRERTRHVSRHDSIDGSRLIRRLRRRKLAGSRDCPFAAFVGIRRGKALSLSATGGGFARERSGEAVEGPDQGQDGQDRDRNVNATTHSD